MNRALNFLHLTTFYPPYSFGGDAMYLYRLCHALADHGHQVDVVHCVDAYHLLHPQEPEIEFDEHPGVHRHELRSGWGSLSPLITQQTGRLGLKARPVKEILAARRYDVIHLHNTSLLGPDLMRVIAEEQAHSVRLYMAHEHWLVCPTHVLFKYNKRPCESPDCVRCVLRARRPPQLWRYTGLLARQGVHLHRFVSPSRFSAAMHAERGFPFPLGHLPYFVDRADADWQQPQPRPHARPYFLFVGRIEKIKGLQRVLPLWSEAPDADLLIAGDGPYRSELEQLAGRDPRIKFLGPLPQEQLGNLYYHALATIVPSLTYETFGIIIIESFARKTPVIVNRIGPLPEIVEDSGGGIAYESPEQLLAALHELAGSPQRRRQLGERGYAGFLRWWTREAHLELYFDLINEVATEDLGGAEWQA